MIEKFIHIESSKYAEKFRYNTDPESWFDAKRTPFAEGLKKGFEITIEFSKWCSKNNWSHSSWHDAFRNEETGAISSEEDLIKQFLKEVYDNKEYSDN